MLLWWTRIILWSDHFDYIDVNVSQNIHLYSNSSADFSKAPLTTMFSMPALNCGRSFHAVASVNGKLWSITWSSYIHHVDGDHFWAQAWMEWTLTADIFKYTVTMNFDLWPWPSNLTHIGSRWTSMSKNISLKHRRKSRGGHGGRVPPPRKLDCGGR